MSRETSPYIVGDFWLDKRRDGKSPDVWQIATYAAKTRQVVYRSTRRRELTDAKAAIHAYVAQANAKGKQKEQDALVAPLLKLFWDERGKNVVSPDQIASSIRQFLAFMIQDEIGAGATIADLTPQVFVRFRQWRMAPHSYELRWGGKLYKHSSRGVKGESVQRNLDDIRAALLHHERNDRVRAPRVANLEERYRSPPRDRVLTPEEIVAIVGYSRMRDPALYRFVALMLATAVRPEAALMFDPAKQWRSGAVDLHPPVWERTKKVNPTVPAIPEFEAVLAQWKQDGVAQAASRKSAWRTMRRVLDLPDDVFPKTIRHSVATWLVNAPGVSADHVETLLGHRVLKRTTSVYAKVQLQYFDPLKAPLSTIWRWVHHGADQWAAVHLLSKGRRGDKITLVRKDAEC